MKEIVDIVKSYIATNRLLSVGRPVIAGFSGGSDSVALLSILNRLGYKCIAAHCNFRLRGDESDRDEAFCRQFARQQKMLFEKVDFDARAYSAKKNISIEMAARELRYEWFETLRKKHDAQAITVAHHRDDSNETILMNMIRGTGIRGLCGIRPKNEMIIRPLLCLGKDDILRYIEAQSLSFVTDSSNQSDEYMRNIIRLRLIPLMKEINPSLETALERMAAHLTDVENIYLQTIEKAKKNYIKKTGDDVISISINDLSELTAAKTILYELLHPYHFTRQQTSTVFNALQGESGKIFDAPDSSYQLLKDRDSLFIYKKNEETTATYPIEKYDSVLSHLPIRLSIRKVEITPSFEIDPSPLTATFDFEKIRFPLILRKWRTGDWFIPFGLKGRKKLSDYFTDRKFSIYKKNKTWLLCCGEDIIWITGERADNRFRLEKNTKFALVIKFFEK